MVLVSSPCPLAPTGIVAGAPGPSFSSWRSACSIKKILGTKAGPIGNTRTGIAHCKAARMQMTCDGHSPDATNSGTMPEWWSQCSTR